MLQLNFNEILDIAQIEDIPSYDGHCLRAYAYWPDQMMDIYEQLEYVKQHEHLIRIEHPNGNIEYLCEEDYAKTYIEN